MSSLITFIAKHVDGIKAEYFIFWSCRLVFQKLMYAVFIRNGIFNKNFFKDYKYSYNFFIKAKIFLEGFIQLPYLKLFHVVQKNLSCAIKIFDRTASIQYFTHFVNHPSLISDFL